MGAGVNRFYLVQLIQVGQNYCTFTHYGRTGERVEEGAYKGHEDFKMYDHGSLEGAIIDFEKWFMKKSSGCPFHDRHNFEQQPGGYNYIELNTINTEKKSKRGGGESVACLLPPSVASMVQLVFDEDQILKTMQAQGVKTDELPLGKLTPALLAQSKQVLVELMELYNAGVHGADMEQAQKLYDAKMERLSSQYFEKIPTQFIMRLDDPAKVSE